VTQPRLSVVTTLYRSAPYVREFYERVREAAAAVSDGFELIFVNDGSPDDSLARALDLHRTDPRVSVVDLSRNFGHHKAMMTGLERATGDLVFLLDSDLEEDPAWLPTFYARMEATGADVVYGVQEGRKGGWLERLTGAAFFRLAAMLLSEPIPANLTTARLMSRRYVRELVRHRDREVFIAGLWAATGFQQESIPVKKGYRGGSSYNLRRRVSVLVNSITSFSNRPLIYVFYLGSSIVGFTSVAILLVLGYWLVSGIGVPGWLSLILSVWLLGGLTIFSVGVIGVYLAKVFTETKDRPYTVVRAEYRHEVGRD
jgi:putative glycosyltransferase